MTMAAEWADLEPAAHGLDASTASSATSAATLLDDVGRVPFEAEVANQRCARARGSCCWCSQ